MYDLVQSLKINITIWKESEITLIVKEVLGSIHTMAVVDTAV